MSMYNQTNSPFQYVVLLRYKSLLWGNLVQTEIVLGDADPPELVWKMGSIFQDEVSRMGKSSCTCKETYLDRGWTFSSKSSQVELPWMGTMRADCVRLWITKPRRSNTVKETSDLGPESDPWAWTSFLFPLCCSPWFDMGPRAFPASSGFLFPWRGLIYSKVWRFGGLLKMVLSLSKIKSGWKHFPVGIYSGKGLN